MTEMRVLWLAAAISGLCSLSGCGDGPDHGSPFADALGSTPAGARSGSAVDTGILADPSSYQPATFEPVSLGASSSTSSSSSGGGGGGADEGPEVAAIRELLDTFTDGLLEGEIDLVLDCFPEERVAALRDGEFSETAYDVAASVRGVWSNLETKSAGTDLEPLMTQVGESLPLFKDVLLSGQTFELVSEDTAISKPDMERFRETVEARRGELVPAIDGIIAAVPASMMGPAAAGGALPDGNAIIDGILDARDAANMAVADMEGQPTPLDQMIKIDGEWKLNLPVTITEDQADSMNSALLAVKDLLDQVNGTIEAQPQISTQELVPLAMQMAPMAMATMGQVQGDMEPVIEEWAEALGGDVGASMGGGGDAIPSPDGGVVFSEDVLPILVDRCAFCHQPGGRATRGGITLDLSLENAHGAVVDQASQMDGNLVLVVPGDADASFFFEKVASDTPAQGQRMPIGDSLSDEEVAVIRAWIEAGAKNDLEDGE